jgi:alkylated DNA repair protein alkB homolog 7
MSFAHLSKRYLSTLIDVKGKSQPRDFSIFPDFFTLSEQRILLTTALHQLDSMESRLFRRRRDAFIRDRANGAMEQSQSLRDLFFPDEYYKMEEVRSFGS